MVLEYDVVEHIDNPDKVMTLVRGFIDKHNISVPETIYQMDSIIEDAYEFIEALCEAAGYAPDDDADLYDNDLEPDDSYQD